MNLIMLMQVALSTMRMCLCNTCAVHVPACAIVPYLYSGCAMPTPCLCPACAIHAYSVTVSCLCCASAVSV